MISSIILILLIVLTVIVAGLFAGAETGMYQLSRLRLRLGIEKGKLSFIILGKAVNDSPALLLSILTGANLSYYITTSIVTYMLLSHLQAEHTAALFATLLTAPMLFIFSELIPKNIFFYRADKLMPYIAPVLYGFHKLLTYCGIAPLLGFISRSFTRLTGTSYFSKTAITALRSPYINVILQETHEEDFLSPVQADIINRLVNISNVNIRSVMTPINKVKTVNINSDNPSMINKLKESAHARLLVFDRWPTNILGFINIYDCLSSEEQFSDLRNFIKPVSSLNADTTVLDAINIMQSQNEKIILVTKVSHIRPDRAIGIVTMKDLVEELLGELIEW